MKHDLIKTGDPDVFEQIQDRNGEVVLGFCRRCREGEGGLAEECPGLPDKTLVGSEEYEFRFCGIASELFLVRSTDRGCEACDCDQGNQRPSVSLRSIEQSLKFYHDRCNTLIAERNQSDAALRLAQPPGPSPLAPNREARGQDGSVRKAHYGEGEQPWDIALRLGWGPGFAATNVLKYIRRTKNPEHSLESARWYWQQIKSREGNEWLLAGTNLIKLLTPDELVLLNETKT